MILFPTGVQGLADTRWQGAQGQAHRLVGIDYRSEPGLIKVHQKLKKDSGTTVTELCKVSVPVSDGSTLWFSSESNKIWREIAGAYTLIWEIVVDDSQITHTVNDAKSFNYSTQVNIATGHCFSADGTKMYVICNAKVSGNGGEIFQYTLSTPWDVSTAVYATKTFAADINGSSMWFKPDGTKFYVGEDNGGTSIIQYNLGTAWDLATASAPGISYNFSAQGSRAFGLQFKADGTKMYIFDAGTYELNEYTLGTAWDLTTVSFTNTFNLPDDFLYGAGFIHPDGTKLYVESTASNGLMREYRFGTPWDVTTLVDTGRTFNVGSDYYFGIGHAVDTVNDKLYFYVGTQTTPESVKQFSLSLAPYTQGVIPLSAEEFSVPALDAVEGDLPTPYIYFTIENRLMRIAVSEVGTPWGIDDVDIITPFKYGDATYHPIKKQNNRLFIGDKYAIAEVNEFGVITLETDFNVLAPEQITTLGIIDTDLLVGTKEPKRAWVKRWDTEALSWFAEDSVEETEIYAFLPADNYVYIIAGDFGRIYFYDGEKMQPEARVPGDYGKTARSKTNDDAIGSFLSIPLFGVSNIEGNPSWQGLYSYGRFSKDYNVTMDLSFPLSCNTFEDVEIGSILVQGFTLMVSWKSLNDVGIDRLDWTSKYESAFIESMVLNGAKDRSMLKSIDNFIADYFELPENTGVEFSVSNNYTGFNDLEPDQKMNTKLNQVQAKATQKELGAVEVMIEFNVDGNNGPKIENFHVNFEGEQ
ncbi:putative isomerase ybhE [Caudoviricetes sp.]|nr:putative isomerase ybhE [Caudoviricetes sp.]